MSDNDAYFKDGQWYSNAAKTRLTDPVPEPSFLLSADAPLHERILAATERAEQAGFERGVQAERERWMSDPEARLYDGRAERDAEIRQHILTAQAADEYYSLEDLLAWIGDGNAD